MNIDKTHTKREAARAGARPGIARALFKIRVFRVLPWRNVNRGPPVYGNCLSCSPGVRIYLIQRFGSSSGDAPWPLAARPRLTDLSNLIAYAVASFADSDSADLAETGLRIYVI